MVEQFHCSEKKNFKNHKGHKRQAGDEELNSSLKVKFWKCFSKWYNFENNFYVYYIVVP